MGRGSGVPNHSVRNNIRHLRFLSGEMTQQRLAETVGVSRQTLNAIELGKYSPSLEVAFKIARALEHPLEAVFEFGQAASMEKTAS